MSINTCYPTANLETRTAATYYKALYDFFSTNEAVLKWCDVSFDDTEGGLYPITFSVKNSSIEVQILAYSTSRMYDIRRQIRASSSASFTTMNSNASATASYADLPVKIGENENSLYISIGGAQYNIVIFNAVSIDDETNVAPAVSMLYNSGGTRYCLDDAIHTYSYTGGNIGYCEKRILSQLTVRGYKCPTVYKVDGGAAALTAGFYTFDGADYAADGCGYLYKL